MEVSDTIIVLILSALEFYYFFKSVFIVAFVSSWFLTHFIGVCYWDRLIWSLTSFDLSYRVCNLIDMGYPRN